MNTRTLALLAFLGAASANRVAIQSGMWTPNDLEIVGKALDAILATPHLSKEQLTSAQSVAAKVRSNLKAVEAGGLKGAARSAKVGEALAALTGLEAEWAEKTKQAKAKEEAADAHMAALEKELAAKKALLAKESDQMKVLTMEKELMEKKLKLNTLMEKKQAMAEQKAKEKEEVERKEVFQTLEAVSQHMSSADARKAALAHVNARMKSVQDAIANIVADEKADQKKFDSMKLDEKVGKMLKSIKKKNHREHAKAKALKDAELANLNSALQSVKKGDANGAKDILDKMKRDAKRLDAKSGDFLH